MGRILDPSWNQKFLDYEIETMIPNIDLCAFRLPLESKVSRLRD